LQQAALRCLLRTLKGSKRPRQLLLLLLLWHNTMLSISTTNTDQSSQRS
jgi:hypothetical protein